MASVLTIVVNGELKELTGLGEAPALIAVIAALELKADRIAVERNGDIVRRATWDSLSIGDGDRLEIVHFVGGGCHTSFEEEPHAEDAKFAQSLPWLRITLRTPRENSATSA